MAELAPARDKWMASDAMIKAFCLRCFSPILEEDQTTKILQKNNCRMRGIFVSIRLTTVSSELPIVQSPSPPAPWERWTIHDLISISL